MRGKDGWYVGFVLPGSPAEQAGLRYGDRLVTVGDYAMDGLPAQVAMRALEGRELTSTRVEAARPGPDGKPRPLDLTLRRTGRTDITRVFLPGHGLLLLGRRRGPLYVAAAGDFRPGGDGQAWDAGPAAELVGAEVEAVNGKPVLYLTRQDWVRAVTRDLRLKPRGKPEVVLPASQSPAA
jgi:membrane-associated protease RseP (regulator of RpoE activity)